MLKSPKQTKYRKQQRMPLKSTKAVRGTQINFGTYGLQVNETKFISAQQLEICRRNLRRIIARKTSI
jgi:large subunit ribosomal protein L16|tara:strand:- start:72 stop:272 length:201 start_codon:yes stop_codon:yes gene_type:complete